MPLEQFSALIQPVRFTPISIIFRLGPTVVLPIPIAPDLSRGRAW